MELHMYLFWLLLCDAYFDDRARRAERKLWKQRSLRTRQTYRR